MQDPHNQAGIAHSGGITPLLKLLESKNGSLQHNAAFALYGLAENEVYSKIEDLFSGCAHKAFGFVSIYCLVTLFLTVSITILFVVG